MNYWYVARPNELFLDIDNASKSLKHARARLQGAIECGKLDVANVMQRESKSKDHLHIIITLNNYYKHESERYVWEIILHGDLYRGCCNIMRGLRRNGAGINASDILISPFEYFYGPPSKEFDRRVSDDSCDCISKHNAAIMKSCPAAIRLRGEFRNAGFFGKPSKNPCTIWPEIDAK